MRTTYFLAMTLISSLLLTSCSDGDKSTSKSGDSNLIVRAHDIDSCVDLSGSYNCEVTEAKGINAEEITMGYLRIRQYKDSRGIHVLDFTNSEGETSSYIGDGAVHTTSSSEVTATYSVNCPQERDEIEYHVVSKPHWRKTKFTRSANGDLKSEITGKFDNTTYSLIAKCTQW